MIVFFLNLFFLIINLGLLKSISVILAFAFSFAVSTSCQLCKVLVLYNIAGNWAFYRILSDLLNLCFVINFR